MLERPSARPTSLRRSISAADATLLTLGGAGFGQLTFPLPAPAGVGALVALALLDS